MAGIVGANRTEGGRMDGGGHAIGSGFCVCTFTGDHWELLEMLLEMSLINSIITHHLVGRKFQLILEWEIRIVPPR